MTKSEIILLKYDICFPKNNYWGDKRGTTSILMPIYITSRYINFFFIGNCVSNSKRFFFMIFAGRMKMKLFLILAKKKNWIPCGSMIEIFSEDSR